MNGTGIGNRWFGFYYNKYNNIPEVTDRVLNIKLLFIGLTIINHSGARTAVDIILTSDYLL